MDYQSVLGIPRTGATMPIDSPNKLYVAFKKTRQVLPMAMDEADTAAYATAYRKKSLWQKAKTNIYEWNMQRISPTFCHCQLIFEWTIVDEIPVRVTFTTNKAEMAGFVERRYTAAMANTWHFVEVCTTPDKVSAVYAWAKRTSGTPFNHFGINWNFFVPWTEYAYDARGSSFFCAEQVATGLLVISEIKLPPGVFTYVCTPDIVHGCLLAAGHRLVELCDANDDTCGFCGESLNSEDTPLSTSLDCKTLPLANTPGLRPRNPIM